MIVMRLSGEAFGFFGTSARIFPAEARAALARVASIVRRKMQAAMAAGGGINGVEKFQHHAALTDFIRGGKQTPMGGVLGLPYAIQMFRSSKNTQEVGFLSSLEGYAEKFQSAEVRGFTKEERHTLYRRGIKGKRETSGFFMGINNSQVAALAGLRAGYNRPARNMVGPVIDAAAPDFPKWLNGAFEKALEKSKGKRWLRGHAA